MKTGLAIWHYPHRTLTENVAYFIGEGYESVSVLGSHFCAAVRDAEEGARLAQLIGESGVELTVHHKLPGSHGAEDVAAFEDDIRAAGAWQAQYGLLSVLSFDVGVREGLLPYVRFVLEHVPGSRVALEDYGLSDAELAEVAPLLEEPRFGYLLDIGHMFIRLRGAYDGDHPIFLHSAKEGAAPDEEGFFASIAGKEFPVFEIHLHNNDGVRDRHFFLEEGALDIPMIARVLRRLDYRGIVTIESAPGYTFPCAGQAADDGIRATRAYWRRCRNAAEN